MIPQQIRALRLSRRMTQEEFGRALGVSTRAVIKWERGERVPGGPAVLLMQQMQKEKPKIPEKR
jgi:DNA-binding transcriptional regulator YiaG